ncbi:MDR family MFS transporter [Levilactobacillus bambusae]|uniref:MFS transporter n=1 Tax=Levilactobacillus bambusae TaxID=2024736 RepID=A0A2V1MX08_9LACO|nr:MFS transporter [Levilactobacillus bambusae]PWF99382.1 MFS transporter [Levilactobacillus bambusae]
MGKTTQPTSIRPIWLYLGSLLINTGISFIWPLTTLYMHNYLHKSLTLAGVVLLMYSGIMIVGNYLGGFAFDRWNRYATIMFGGILTAVATGFLIFFHGWPAYPVWLVLSGLGNGIVVTAINSFATTVRTQRTSLVFNILYFTNNLGLVIGTLIVGFLLDMGIKVVFTVAFVLLAAFVIMAALVYGGHEKPAETGEKEALATDSHARPSQLHRVFALFAVLIVIWIFYEQWQSTIATFMTEEGLAVKDYSFLWTINAILIVLLQPIMTFFDSWLLRHLNGRLYVGFFLIGSSFVTLHYATSYFWFILAMVLLTLGEVISLPATTTFVDLYTSESSKGRYQGMLSAATSAGRAFGPLVGALIVDATSYNTLFWIATIAIWIFTVGFMGMNRDRSGTVTKQQSEAGESTPN